jgi:hypothetical protein
MFPNMLFVLSKDSARDIEFVTFGAEQHLPLAYPKELGNGIRNSRVVDHCWLASFVVLAVIIRRPSSMIVG